MYMVQGQACTVYTKTDVKMHLQIQKHDHALIMFLNDWNSDLFKKCNIIFVFNKFLSFTLFVLLEEVV